MTTSRRCTSCDTNWPMIQLYEVCPTCKLPTWVAAGEKPIPPAEAADLAQDRAREADESRRRHEEFNRLYAEREAEQFAAELDRFEGIT